MMAMAIDVGITTGVVYGTIQAKRMPSIFGAHDVIWKPGDGLYELNLQAKWFYPQYARSMLIVVEFPINNPHSKGNAKTQACTQLWKRWLEHRFIWSGGKVVSVEVTPATWKGTPAKKQKVFEEQPLPWNRYRASVHEKDVARILYWFAHWGDFFRGPKDHF